MKKTLQNILFGKSTFTNGLIALAIMGSIVLGCTCNGEKFGDFGSKEDSNSSEDINKDANVQESTTPEKKEITKSDASKGELPEDDELVAIIRETLLDFDKAVKSEDFTEFYNKSSEPFQESISPRRMKSKFQKFIDGKADISGIDDLEPDYETDPKISKQGKTSVLEVKGEFPTKPRPSKFELKYIPEGKDWKVISIQVFTTVYKKS